MNERARPKDAPRFPSGRVGLISDTHGLLRPQALDYLAGCKLIVHAGDIGGPDILDTLSRIAPVIGVRGNNDPSDSSLRESEFARIGELLLYVIHDQADIDWPELHAQGVGVVVTGHSHKPLIERREGILWVNPGSAGPRRFTLPIAVGELHIEPGRATAEIVNVMDGSRLAAA